MRPITVTVGPLAAAAPGGIATGQQPANSQFQLNGTGGPVLTTGWTGTGAIANGVLGTIVTGAGMLRAGMRLNGLGVLPNTTVIGPGPTAGTWIVYPTQTLGNGPLRANVVVTLDAPRQVVVTTTSTTGAIVIQGTDGGGNPISETLACNGASLTTSQSFATVTQAYVIGAMSAAAVIGTGPTATSQWVMFDPWAMGAISKQCEITGAPTYSLQISNDDPNAPGGPAPGAMVWANDPDATFVGATTSVFGSWSFTPLWARVLLSAGANSSVQATFVQQGSP